jgi:hypothetical protein
MNFVTFRPTQLRMNNLWHDQLCVNDQRHQIQTVMRKKTSKEKWDRPTQMDNGNTLNANQEDVNPMLMSK